VGDAVGGVFDQRVVDRLVVDGADQVLGGRLGQRAALQQAVRRFPSPWHRVASGFDRFMDQADFTGAAASIRSADWK
jgi:hypothetical protein